MLPLIQKRFFSHSQISRKSHKIPKKTVRIEKNKPAKVPEYELRKQKIRRIEKAARDERMDITMMLSPVKTYMGGFTRPRDLRCSNWFPGGAYRIGKKGKGPKKYEKPLLSMYRPYTVFVLHSRHYIKTPRDQKDQQKFITGLCLASDFHKVLRFHNSLKGPKTSVEDMDNAIWPWYDYPLLKKVKWWQDSEERIALRRQHEEGEFEDPSETPSTAEESKTASISDQSNPSSDEIHAPSVDSQVEPLEEANIVPKADQAEATTTLTQNVETESASSSQSDDSVSSEEPESAHSVQSGDSVSSAEPELAHNESPSSPLVTESSSETASSPNPISSESEPANNATLTSSPPTESPSEATTSGSVPSSPQPVSEKEKSKNKYQNQDEEDEEDKKPAVPALTKKQLDDKIAKIRLQYEPTLQEQPFWRPLVMVTFPTRPIALSVERLAKSLPRGLPFYASMVSDDRKCLYSYTSRMINLRSDRILSLTKEVSERLAGDRGGFPGLRFNPDQPGRSIDGCMLDEPIPEDKRRLKIGIGEYYERADELKEWAREEVVCADVFGLDDWGRRVNADGSVEEVPLPKPGESEEIELIEEEDDEGEDEGEDEDDD